MMRRMEPETGVARQAFRRQAEHRPSPSSPAGLHGNVRVSQGPPPWVGSTELHPTTPRRLPPPAPARGASSDPSVRARLCPQNGQRETRCTAPRPLTAAGAAAAAT
eukprot:TRINITY_DN12146_c0_g1_i1.p3 TRINITY_DN12146_c0_g1~~TRINITY_DN12146_c0_g1_i1.p3  ORF type:complete len:106 (-),score=1.95 TRINITY_DN12146_c0_g1_i1:63-380(-)